MNDSTIKPNNETIHPESSNGTIHLGGNDGTVRPDGNEGTIRPEANNGEDSNATIKPSAGVEDNGSTIRPGADNNGSTIRTTNNNSTIVAGNNGGTIVGSNVGSKPQQQATNTANADYKNQKGAIFGFPDIYIDGKKLHVVEYLKQVSGEAQLIKVESKGKLYMLKLYLSGIHPNHDMLEKVKTIPQGMPGLMRLYKHGTWTHPIDTNDVRDYEIMELCEGGTLSDINLNGDEERWKELAIQMAISIDLCHKRGFLHLDVKPDNFLFVDKKQTNLVLGDFGLAVAIDANGKGQCSQARTKKYAAPEIYSHIEGQLIDVDDKSDFYSLGISLMRLWMGEKEFDKIFEGKNERQLIKMKQYEQIPMPSGLSPHSLSLIKALLLFNNSERAGFADIQRWAKGENLVEDENVKAQDIPKLSIIYNGAKNQVAHSMNELAKFMLEDKELAKKYLYSGKLSKLIDLSNPEIALNIDQITEEWYPTNKEAGLAAAIYTLDEDYPWTDIEGKQIRTFAEIAKSLLYNLDQYRKDLQNENHTFYAYLRVNDEQEWADSIHKQLENGAQDNLLRFIYEYNAKLPFRIITTDDQIHYVDKIDDVLQYGENLSEESQWEITCIGFTKWLKSHNGMIAAEVEKYLQEEDWETECYPGVLYLLNKKCGYNYRIVNDANDPNSQFTPAQLAARLNKLVADYGNNSKRYTFFQEFMNINGTRLERYLKLRGFANQISYIKYCFDLNSKTHQGKPGPYNEIIAAYRCIAGMGFTPYYLYKGKKLTSLADFEKLSCDEQRAEYKKGQLGNWLTIFFQEDPKLNLNKAYAYELQTEKYVRYVEDICYDDYYVDRFRDALDKTEACVERVNRLQKRVLALKWIVILLGIVPLTFLAIYMAFMGLPFDVNSLGAFNGVVFTILFIICTLAVFALADGAGGCIGAGVVGAIATGLIYWGLGFLLKLLLPYSEYIVGALLLIYAWTIYRSCIGSVYINTSTNLLGKDEVVVAPLHFAFNSKESISDFTPTVALKTDKEESYLESVIQKIKKKTLWSVITSVLIISLLVYMGANDGSLSSKTANEEMLVGSWNGEFQGKNATLVIDNVDTDKKKLSGTMYVKFKNMAQETVTGTYDNISGEIRIYLEDKVQNGVLDGTYNIAIKDNGSVLVGTYTNSKTKKEIAFELYKADKEDKYDEAHQDDGYEDPEITERNNRKKVSNKKETSNEQREANSDASTKTSNTKSQETSKQAEHKINLDGSNSSSSHSIDLNSGNNSSSGGFKLEEIN